MEKKKIIIGVGIVLIAILGLILVSSIVADDSVETLKDYDLNNDGYIEESEFSTFSKSIGVTTRISETFEQFDYNNDGKWNHAEEIAFSDEMEKISNN